MRETLIEEMQGNLQNHEKWNTLGCRYYRGDDRPQNYAKAKLCFEEALQLNPNQGSANYNLGLLYRYGRGVQPDFNKAKAYLQEAIYAWKEPNRKHEKARRELLQIEMRERHWHTALEWSNLGIKYHDGIDGRVQDYVNARLCYEKALKIDENEATANCNLGLLYRHGQGVQADLNRAKAYFQAAIQAWETPDRKHEKARREFLKTEMLENHWGTAEEWNSLGVKYRHGTDGRVQDYVNAHLCYEQAVQIDPNLGSTNYNLGLCYQNGRGVQTDLTKAKSHFEVAIQAWKENIKDRDDGNARLAEIDKTRKNAIIKIFKAAYENDLTELKRLVSPDPTFLVNNRFAETSPVVTQAVAWTSFVAKKTVGGFVALCALTGATAITAETAGVGSLAAGTLTGVAYGAWKGFDKDLGYYMKLRGGWTPLHFAALGNASEAAQHLIERGADINILSDKGEKYSALGGETFLVKCELAIARRENIRERQEQANHERELAQQRELERRNREAEQRHQLTQRQMQLQQLLQKLYMSQQNEQERQMEIDAMNTQLKQQNIALKKMGRLKLLARHPVHGEIYALECKKEEKENEPTVNKATFFTNKNSPPKIVSSSQRYSTLQPVSFDENDQVAENKEVKITKVSNSSQGFFRGETRLTKALTQRPSWITIQDGDVNQSEDQKKIRLS